MLDRSSKLLLAVIAAGLWANVFLSVGGAKPAQAQGGVVQVDLVRVDGRLVSATMGIPIQGTTIGKPVEVKVAR